MGCTSSQSSFIRQLTVQKENNTLHNEYIYVKSKGVKNQAIRWNVYGIQKQKTKFYKSRSDITSKSTEDKLKALGQSIPNDKYWNILI